MKFGNVVITLTLVLALRAYEKIINRTSIVVVLKSQNYMENGNHYNVHMSTRADENKRTITGCNSLVM